MPNWCYTNYAIKGPEEQVKKLYDTMNELQEMKEPLVENDFGVTWLGCLVKKLGGDPQTVYDNASERAPVFRRGKKAN